MRTLWCGIFFAWENSRLKIKKELQHFLPESFTSEEEAKQYALKQGIPIDKIKEVITGDSDPENVILLDIEPEKQKTYIDFLCTEKYLGIKPVCITEIIKEKNKFKLFLGSDAKFLKLLYKINSKAAISFINKKMSVNK